MTTHSSANKAGRPLTLAIKESQVNVAPEGKVVVQTAIINNQAEDDQAAMYVKGIPAEWVTIESQVSYITPGAVKQIELTIQPPPFPQSDVGEYAMEVQVFSKNHPNHMASVKCAVTVAAYESEGRIGVLLGSVQFSVIPDTSITVPMILKNRGVKDDAFILSVEGIPANWVTTTSPVTKVEASQSKEIQFNLQIPKSSTAPAGRTRFKILVTSQDYSVDRVEVECTLTVSAFSQFSGTLEPDTLQSNEPGRFTIKNEGNTIDTYNLSFRDPANELVFEKATQAPKKNTKPNDPNPEYETVFSPVAPGESVRIPAGESSVLEFRSRPRVRAIVGGEKIFTYTAKAQSSSKAVTEFQGKVSTKALIPMWLVALAVIALIVMCLMVFVPPILTDNSASSTQTASANMTQAANAGLQDTDGDGLSNDQEAALQTDPTQPDTDADGLRDGEEVSNFLTSPLAPDSDNDGLKDGDEVQRYRTDPLLPDTDGDILTDGDEINRNSDPLNPDTDRDGLTDGTEVGLGTDPRKEDTDNDRLLDGQENQTCPQPLNPDTDGDGIIDGRDANPCDATNPALTPTTLPTNVPTIAPPPTQTFVPTPTVVSGFPTLPTEQAGVQPTVTVPVQAAQAPTTPESGVFGNVCGSTGGAAGIVILGAVLGLRRKRRLP
jgi:hypothetical protein